MSSRNAEWGATDEGREGDRPRDRSQLTTEKGQSISYRRTQRVALRRQTLWPSQREIGNATCAQQETGPLPHPSGLLVLTVYLAGPGA